MCYIVGDGFTSIYFVGNFLVIIGGATFARIRSLSFSLLMGFIFLQHIFIQCLLPFDFKDLITTIMFMGSAVILSIFMHSSIRQYEDMLLKTQEELYAAATTDPLTNLYNRRKIINLIELEEIRSARNKREYVLAVGDIDNFKQINDTYGHDVGDTVLVSAAKIMKDTLRTQDSIGRWGGEEFLIILPETKMSEGKLAIDRMREQICNSSIQTPNGSIKISITFGMADSKQANNIDLTIKLADDALYKGKHGTKNCVVVAD